MESAVSQTVLQIHQRLFALARTVIYEPLMLYVQDAPLKRVEVLRMVIATICFALLLAVILTILNEENAQLPVGPFLLLWWLQIMAASFPLLWATRFFHHLGFSRIPVLIYAYFTTIPCLGLASLLIDHVFGVDDPDDLILDTWLMQWLSESVEVMPSLGVIWLLVSVFLFLEVKRESPLPATTADDNNNWSEYLNEVPPAQRGILYAIRVDQHYLEIYTDKGQTLIRGSLKEAIESLHPLVGLHIHRSYWVVLQHVQRIAQKEGRYYCVLPRELYFPISRRKVTEVKATFLGLDKGIR